LTDTRSLEHCKKQMLIYSHHEIQILKAKGCNTSFVLSSAVALIRNAGILPFSTASKWNKQKSTEGVYSPLTAKSKRLKIGTTNLWEKS
jgi:hypothetical protein